jgi:class 3 adenylate cyclase
MGLVIALGLSIGTLFTLFVVPAFYILLAADHCKASTAMTPPSSTRPIQGEHRAPGSRMRADLSGFTRLTDGEDPSDVVRWLKEHLEAIRDPVIDNGGEILKFLGDGLLAVFPAAAVAVSRCRSKANPPYRLRATGY